MMIPLTCFMLSLYFVIYNATNPQDLILFTHLMGLLWSISAAYNGNTIIKMLTDRRG